MTPYQEPLIEKQVKEQIDLFLKRNPKAGGVSVSCVTSNQKPQKWYGETENFRCALPKPTLIDVLEFLENHERPNEH